MTKLLVVAALVFVTLSKAQANELSCLTCETDVPKDLEPIKGGDGGQEPGPPAPGPEPSPPAAKAKLPKRRNFDDIVAKINNWVALVKAVTTECAAGRKAHTHIIKAAKETETCYILTGKTDQGKPFTVKGTQDNGKMCADTKELQAADVEGLLSDEKYKDSFKDFKIQLKTLECSTSNQTGPAPTPGQVIPSPTPTQLASRMEFNCFQLFFLSALAMRSYWYLFI